MCGSLGLRQDVFEAAAWNPPRSASLFRSSILYLYVTLSSQALTLRVSYGGVSTSMDYIRCMSFILWNVGIIR